MRSNLAIRIREAGNNNLAELPPRRAVGAMRGLNASHHNLVTTHLRGRWQAGGRKARLLVGSVGHRGLVGDASVVRHVSKHPFRPPALAAQPYAAGAGLLGG